MKIFLTGGTGFIGSNFINRAIKKGHKLHCLRRSDKEIPVKLAVQPTWHYGTLEDDWTSILEECEILVHLAAHSANAPYDNLINCLKWNLTATMQLLEKARLAGIKNFLIAGSGFEYGSAGEMYDEIPTSSPLLPTVTYAASKAIASIAIRQWSLENNLHTKYLRIFQVFGEGESEQRLWPALKKAALSGRDFYLTKGEQIRDFTHVSKVVEELVIGVEKRFEENFFTVQHVGTGQPQSLRQFVEYWWKTWNAKGKLHFGSKPYRDGEIMRYIPKL